MRRSTSRSGASGVRAFLPDQFSRSGGHVPQGFPDIVAVPGLIIGVEPDAEKVGILIMIARSQDIPATGHGCFPGAAMPGFFCSRQTSANPRSGWAAQIRSTRASRASSSNASRRRRILSPPGSSVGSAQDAHTAEAESVKTSRPTARGLRHSLKTDRL